MAVSVIIVTRNTRDLTLACLASLAADIDSGCEVIVVDNASSDGTESAIREAWPSVKVVRNSENVGFGRANNQGAALASSDILLFLNSDTVVPRGAIALLAAGLDARPEVGMAVPQLLCADGSEQETVAYLVTPATEVLSSARRRARRWLKSALQSGEPLAGRAYFSGAALMVRRKAFEEVAGFDESIFLYFEDADLCKRIADAGWQAHFASEVRITHLGGASSGQASVGAMVEMMRSRGQYIRKNFGALAAGVVLCAQFGRRLSKCLLNGIGTIFTLGTHRRLRQSALSNAAVCLWFVLGMPRRDSSIYRRLFCDWEA